MEKQSVITSNYAIITSGILFLIGLYFTSLYNSLCANESETPTP